MNSKFTLIFIVLSFGIVTLSSADYATGLNAYKKGDYKTALMEWQPLAEKGLSEAQYNLAGMFAKGYGVVVDDERASCICSGLLVAIACDRRTHSWNLSARHCL